MAYKNVVTVQITDKKAVSLINSRAAEQNRSASNAATVIILEALAAVANNTDSQVSSQVQNGM